MSGAAMSPSVITILGWTLVHFLWQGSAIAIGLGLVLGILPRSFARSRYACRVHRDGTHARGSSRHGVAAVRSL